MTGVGEPGDEWSAAAEKYLGRRDPSDETDHNSSTSPAEQPDAAGRVPDRYTDDGPGPEDRRPGSPRQLPLVRAFFVSRGAELADLDALMDLHARESGSRASVAVVVGPGGVGKTALAVMWANRHAERFPDGQLYVDLRGFSPDTTVAPVDALGRFLRALGFDPEQMQATVAEQVSLYRTITAGRQLLMLVVLDNAASAEQVRPLIPTSTRSVVVVTSWLRLDGLFADGTQLVQVPPLPEAAAVALLEELIGERSADEPDATTELAQLYGLWQPSTTDLPRRNKRRCTTEHPATANFDERTTVTHDHAKHEDPGDWWNAYRKIFPAAVIALFEVEAHATSAQVFSASAFPAPVQEPDYAEAVLRSYGDSFTAEKIQHAIAARAMRRAAYLDGGLEASFIVDASVLQRAAGSDTIMMKQHTRAKDLHLWGRAPIKVTDGFYYGMETSFSLFTVGGDILAFEDTEKVLVQVDGTRRDELVTRFDNYARRATPLVDHPLLRLSE